MPVCSGTVSGCGYNGQRKMLFLFVIIVDYAKQFKVHSSQFFADFDKLLRLLMSRSGNFCGDDNGRDTIDYTPCACTWGNYM